MTHHELVLPVRTPSALRQEVAGRVAHRRKQRARRRAVRLAVPAAAAVLAFVLGANGLPGASTGVHTTDDRSGPASEGSSELRAHGRPTAGSRADELATDGHKAAADVPTRNADGRRPAVSPATTTSAPSVGDTKPPSAVADPTWKLAVSRADGIWELEADGTPVRRLVSTGSEPAWSPDGRRLAYTKRWEGVNGGVGVAVLDLDTMQSRYVAVGSEADYRNPVWSPDGSRLALSRHDTTVTAPPDLQPSVMVVDADGSNRFELGPGDWPSWLYDGRILYRCGNKLCVRSTVEGGTTTEVPSSGDLLGAVWSPDGRWIAAWEHPSQQVVALRVDGGDRRTVVSRATGSPAWSPDGTRIVYPSTDGLRSVRIDGSDVRVVTEQPLDADPDLVGGRR